MKYFISMLVILALVITIGLVPSVSYAMSHDGVKAQALDHKDCHHHDVGTSTIDKTVQNDQDHSGKCCDKGICKCIGSNCHGMSKMFSNSGNALSTISSSSVVFTFDNQFMDSILPNRVKRPPKA